MPAFPNGLFFSPLLKLAEKPTYNYERGAIHLDKKKSVETDDEDEKNELIE